jgi:hypothetical protein
VSLIIIGGPEPRGRRQPPRWQVQCPRCLKAYVLLAWPKDVSRRKSCKPCQLAATRRTPPVGSPMRQGECNASGALSPEYKAWQQIRRVTRGVYARPA